MSKSYRQFFGTCLAILLFTLVCTLQVFSQQVTHEVKEGETLYSIARQYDVTVRQIKEWNGLESNELRRNQILIVGKRGEGRLNNTPADSLTHTVQKQETLFSISKKYNVTISEVKSWNNLQNDNLNVGQELRIYPSKTGELQVGSIVEDRSEVQNNTYYTVKSGDSLYRIARNHGMTVDELKELNGLTTNNINVGQQLTVRETNSSPPSVADNASSSPQGKFISYRVSGNEDLQQILTKFDMDEAEFTALNPSVDSESIRNGQQLTVLAPPSRIYENPYRTNAALQDLGTTSVSRYSSSEKANPTTNGELYNPEALTAAHPNISMGTVIFVQNPENGKGVYVRINDRTSGADMKLSEAAWTALDFRSAQPTVNIYQE